MPEQFKTSQLHAVWDGINERRTVPHSNVPGVNELEAYIDRRLTDNAAAHREYFDARFDELAARLDSGFPGGDATTHRKVHEAYIKEAEDRAKFWAGLKEKTAASLVWALIAGIGMLTWYGIKQSLGIKA